MSYVFLKEVMAMKLEEVDIKPELSFVLEVELNRNGMIEEIKTEFDIIRMCLTQLGELTNDYVDMIDRLVVMTLRKLLCDKESILLKVVPELRLPPIGSKVKTDEDGLNIILPDLSVTSPDKWIPIKKWRNNNIAWIDKSVSDLPPMYPAFIYEKILDKMNFLVDQKRIKRVHRQKFETLFTPKSVIYKDNVEEVYMRKNHKDQSESEFIFSLLKKIGYYDLNTYDFIKHLSNKRGAHIDTGLSALVYIVNDPVVDRLKPTTCIALKMIWAVKHQIPELADYWPDMQMSQV